MYALINCDEIITIDGLTKPEVFFRNLPKLFVDGSYILGIGSYAPDAQIKRWFDSLPKSDVPKEFNYSFLFDTHRKKYPLGGAYYVIATDAILNDFADWAAKVGRPELLCDHLIGVIRNEALFSFHEAFCGESMLISPFADTTKIDRFCAATGATWRKVVNPQIR